MRSLFRGEKISSRRFEPIRILPFTLRQKRKLIRTAAVPAETCSFPFNLSSRPPFKWVELFQTAWYQQQGGSEIPRLNGRTLMVASTASDLQNTLSILKLVVTSANEKYQALLRQQTDAEEAERMRREDIKSRAEREMGDALNRLNF